MRDDWNVVPLGDVISKRTDFVPVDPASLYPVVGVQRSGLGLVVRDPILGSAQKFTKLMSLEAHDLVYRTITAFEAPATVVSDADAGLFVTPQTFPVYRLDQQRVLPDYMRALTTWPVFHEEMAQRCTGTVLRRKTLSDSAFRSIPVALPPLAEQRRIVDLLEAVDHAIMTVERAHRAASQLARQWRAAAFSVAASKVATSPAGELFEMQLGRQKSARQSVGDHVIPYIRAGNVGSAGLRLGDLQEMNFSPAEQRKYVLCDGDVLLAEGGTLGVSTRWTGQVLGPVGFDKHVIRLRGVPYLSTSDYAHQWCQWSYETGAFDEQATGVTIRALGFGRASKMPVPALSLEDQSSLTARLGAADAVAVRHSVEHASLRELRANILSALLSGEHEIPDSYDELLTG